MNSKLIYTWLYLRGKRKGEALELIKTPVSEIPIMDLDAKKQAQIIDIVSVLIKTPNQQAKLAELNSLIFDLYGLSSSEVKAVEDFYAAKTATSKRDKAA